MCIVKIWKSDWKKNQVRKFGIGMDNKKCSREETLSSYKCNFGVFVNDNRVRSYVEKIQFHSLHCFINIWIDDDDHDNKDDLWCSFPKWFRLVHELRLPVPYMNEGYIGVWVQMCVYFVYHHHPQRVNPCDSHSIGYWFTYLNISSELSNQHNSLLSNVDDYDDEANDSDNDNLNHHSTTYCDALNQFHCSLR